MTAHRLALHRAVPSDLRGEFLDKLAYCHEGLARYALADDGAAVTFDLSDDAEIDAASARIDALARAMIDRHKAVERVVVFEQRVQTPHRAPIWDELRARRSVFESGPGLITLAGDGARVAEALDDLFVRIAHDEFQAEDHRYPTMLAMDAMDRCHYFSSFPHHVTFAPHVREDLSAIKEFAASTAGTRQMLDKTLAPPSHILSPAVCFHTYRYLADRPLAGPTTVTANGRCFRYEGKNFSMVERIWDFSLREIVFVGPKQWVLDRRQATIDSTIALVKRLGLDAWIETANDPFFINNYVAQRYFQLTNMAKLELRLGLPYAGTSIAAASYNSHLDFFGRSFAIAEGTGFAHTGCVGYGIERWTWALFAQFGPDVAGWPEAVRTTLRL
jgi:seryl-tRNA synthetase